jgi:hypothetical protein
MIRATLDAAEPFPHHQCGDGSGMRSPKVSQPPCRIARGDAERNQRCGWRLKSVPAVALKSRYGVIGAWRSPAEACVVTLFPSHFSQRFIDPVLPARPGFLEMVKHIPIDAQRDHLFDVRKRGFFGRSFRGLRGCDLERCFGHLSRVHWSSCSLLSHSSTFMSQLSLQVVASHRPAGHAWPWCHIRDTRGINDSVRPRAAASAETRTCTRT